MLSFVPGKIDVNSYLSSYKNASFSNITDLEHENKVFIVFVENIPIETSLQ